MPATPIRGSSLILHSFARICGVNILGSSYTKRKIVIFKVIWYTSKSISFACIRRIHRIYVRVWSRQIGCLLHPAGYRRILRNQKYPEWNLAKFLYISGGTQWDIPRNFPWQPKGHHHLDMLRIKMGLSAPMTDCPYLNLAVRPNELRNVWYELQA